MQERIFKTGKKRKLKKKHAKNYEKSQKNEQK